MRTPNLFNIKKYVSNNCYSLLSYSSSFKANILSGMFDFEKEDAPIWAGPWGETGVIMLLDDETNSNDLEDGYESEGYASMAMPYRIYLAGTDDVSYSKVFATIEDMYDCACSLVETPTQKHMSELGFVFTN